MGTLLTSGILHLLSGGEEVVIGATDGTETLAGIKNVFVTIDSDLGLDGKYWSRGQLARGKPKTSVEVFRMVKDATFEQIFDLPLGRPRQDLLLTPAQVKRFCCDYFPWLCRGGFTFFLSKIDRKFIVGRVRLDVSGYLQLHAGVSALSYRAKVWEGEYHHRVVVPKRSS
ncbi:MAG: hypothetical protein WC531_03615 [Candidatus Paceibacterota bacterium]